MSLLDYSLELDEGYRKETKKDMNKHKFLASSTVNYVILRLLAMQDILDK